MGERSAHRSSVCFALSILLGLCVLGWGTHYKLSLYQASTVHSAQEPAAKLLSEQQRPLLQAATSALRPATPPLALTPLFLFALLLTYSAGSSALLRLDQVARPAFPAVFLRGSHLRRPPPDLPAWSWTARLAPGLLFR